MDNIIQPKEPFDFMTFAELYPHDTGNCERLGENTPEADRAEYERRYYSDREVFTIADFAEKLDRLDESM